MNGTRWSIFVGALLAACTSGLHAQAYRVALAQPQSPTITIAQFQPCVAGSSARCGAWVDRDVNTTIDHSFGSPPGALNRARTPNGAYGLSFAAVAVRITSLATADSGGHADVKVPGRTPRAVIASPDSRYAFAVFSSLGDGLPEVCMIDLRSHAVVATLDAKNPVSGIGMVP